MTKQTQKLSIRSTAPEARRASVLVQMGIARSSEPTDNDALQQRIAGFIRLWPAVLLSVLIGHAPLAFGGGSHITLSSQIAMAVLALLVIAPLLIGRVAALHRLKPHLKVALLGAIVSSIAFCSSYILLNSGRDASDWGTILFLIGSSFITVTALSRIPVLLLMFVGVQVGSLLVAAQSGVTAAIVIPLLLSLGMIAFEIARSDFAASRKLNDALADTSRPLRLLEEIEERGTVWFWETDRYARITYLSPKIAAALNLRAEDLAGRPLSSIVAEINSGDEFTAVGERTLGFFLSTKTAFADLSVRASCEEERWWSISGRPVYDSFDQLRGFIGTGTDLTETRRSDAEKARLARFDALTGLANRAEISNLLRQAMGDKGARGAALFLIDLDRFKNVNDTLGHPAGDALLKQVAQRLANAIGSHGQVGRLGGDEFEVVLPGKTATSHLQALAIAIIESVSRPYVIDGAQVTIGASVGIAIAPQDGTTSENLTRNADLALYAAKAAGRGVHRFYSPDMHASANRRRELEGELERALERDGLRLVYQPVVSCVGEELTGFEALLRWTHPQHGPISPTEFIAIAEESSLIERIGAWVLRKACEEAASWGLKARIAVNVSPIQFANPAFPTLVSQVLAQTGLAPDRLELEITEGVFLADDGLAERQFETLKRIGVRLALDDFGTGYSSLGYLQRAPLNKIKIDQSFVRGATLGNNQNEAIIRSIVTLAEALGMETTAEGAETEDEIELIRSLGCSHVQGYYYGPPLEVNQLLERTGAGSSAAAAVGHKTSRSPRKSLLRRGTLVCDDRELPIRLRNISDTGVMFEAPTVFIPGKRAELHIQDGPVLPVTVVWWSDNRCGAAFDETIGLEWLANDRWANRLSA